MPAAWRTDQTSAVEFIKWASGASLVLALVQLLLGASPVILLLCLATEAVTFVPISIYGLRRTVGILYIGIWLSFSFGALLGKTILLQPINSNLFNPLLTFCIALAGGLAFAIPSSTAFFIKPLQRNALAPLHNPAMLSILAAMLATIGAAAFVITSLTPTQSIYHTVSVQFIQYFIYSIICEMASTILRSDRKRIISNFGIFLCLILFAFGVAGNSKSIILSIGAAYVLCHIAFGVRPNWKVILSGLLALAFLSEFLFPAIHITRVYRGRLDPVEMAGSTVQTVGNLLIGDKETLAQKDLLGTHVFTLNNDLYRNVYFGSQQVWLDRFTNIGVIDAVARRVDFDGPFLGPNFVLGQTLEFLPRQFNPGKETTFKTSGGDRITAAYGLANQNVVTYQTVPLPIQLYCASGFVFIFIIGIPLILIYILWINFICFNFTDNVWSVGLLVANGFIFYESTYEMLVFATARSFPTDLIIFTLLILAAASVDHGLKAAGGRRGAPRISAGAPSAGP